MVSSGLNPGLPPEFSGFFIRLTAFLDAIVLRVGRGAEAVAEVGAVEVEKVLRNQAPEMDQEIQVLGLQEAMAGSLRVPQAPLSCV